MKALDLRLELTVPAAGIRALSAAALLCALSTRLASENVNLATFYPAPSGVYSQMFSTQQTWVGRDPGGYLAVGTAGPLAAGTVMSVMGSAAGIGVTTPSDVLEVDAPAGNAGGSYGVLIAGECAGVRLNQAPGVANPALELETGGCGTGGVANSVFLQSAGNVQLQSGGLLAMTVPPSGRVGIGTAVPVADLDVNGSVAFAGCAGQRKITNPTTCTHGVEYATWVPGIMSVKQYGTVQADDNTAQFYCCKCPAGGCF